MTEQQEKNNLTGPGAFGGPRPGEEGIQRVLSPSSSDVRREQQVADQACSSHAATDLRGMIDLGLSDFSSSGDSILALCRTKTKRRKRRFPSTSPSLSEAEMLSDKEEEQRKAGILTVPPPSKGSKKLPLVEERLVELRHKPSAILAENIMEAADAVEMVALKSGNLKGTFVRRLKDESGICRANAIELARRTSSDAALMALEKENIILRARLQKAEEEIQGLKLRQQVSDNRERVPPEAPPTVSKAKSVAEVSKLANSDVRKEMRALAEQMKALKELVTGLINGDRPAARREPMRRQTASSEKKSSEKKRPSNGREGLTKERKPVAQEKAPDQPRADPQQRPMSAAIDPTTTWVKVVGRKEKAAQRRAEKAPIRKDTTPRVERERGQRPTPKGTPRGREPKVNPPRRAAVAITIAPGSTKTCGEVLATARAKIRLSELGVPVSKIRQTMAGGLLIEIPGQDGPAKADILAGKLQAVFEESKDIRIARPNKRAEIRIRGLDVSIQPREVKEAVAAEGGCSADDVRTGEILKRSPRGMGTVWVQCPVLAAKTLADKGKIVIGWTTARVEVLRARPMTCYRCLEKGHTAGSCTSMKDRSDVCYNCGERGHRARGCTSPPKCLVCFDAGVASNHRFGGWACNPPAPRKQRRVAGNKQAPPMVETRTSQQCCSEAEESGPGQAMEIGT